jgi:hypothetical protein
VVLNPLGAKQTVEPRQPPALTDFISKIRAARSIHTDTYAAGPPLAEVQKVLAAGKTGGAGGDTLYLINDYRALPGHRDELQRTIGRIAATTPGTSVTFEHIDGAPWDFLTISRLGTLAEYARDQADPQAEARAKQQGFASPEAISLELRQHMAAHHDTYTTRLK